MRFREAIRAEAFDLPEKVAGEFLGVAVGQHALDQLLLELVDDAGPLPGAHGAPQLVGFTGSETRRHDHELHGLLLK